MSVNGLELKEISSKIVSVAIDSLKGAFNSFNSNGYVVVYLDYKVLIGRVDACGFEFYNDETIEERYIQRLRLFNEQKELLIWREDSGLKGRLRTDEDGERTYVVDACQVLWGTNRERLSDEWLRLYEQRGTELILPYGNVEINDRNKRLFLKTRNYIAFHPKTSQATYTDCRFVGFTERPL